MLIDTVIPYAAHRPFLSCELLSLDPGLVQPLDSEFFKPLLAQDDHRGVVGHQAVFDRDVGDGLLQVRAFA